MDKSVKKKNFLNQCFESPVVKGHNSENSNDKDNSFPKGEFLVNDSIETTPFTEKTNILSRESPSKAFVIEDSFDNETSDVQLINETTDENQSIETNSYIDENYAKSPVIINDSNCENNSGEVILDSEEESASEKLSESLLESDEEVVRRKPVKHVNDSDQSDMSDEEGNDKDSKSGNDETNEDECEEVESNDDESEEDESNDSESGEEDEDSDGESIHTESENDVESIYDESEEEDESVKKVKTKRIHIISDDDEKEDNEITELKSTLEDKLNIDDVKKSTAKVNSFDNNDSAVSESEESGIKKALKTKKKFIIESDEDISQKESPDNSIVLDRQGDHKSFSNYRNTEIIKDNSNDFDDDNVISDRSDSSLVDLDNPGTSNQISSPNFSSTIVQPKSRKSIETDSPSIDEKSRPAVRSDSPEIIELSDTATPEKKQATIHGFLEKKNNKDKMKSDLYEQGNDDMYNRMLEKLKDQKPSKSGMKMMDMNEEVERKLAALDNPKKFSVNAQRGATQAITNRNFSFEDQLKALSENMLEIFEEKPNPESSFEDLKPPSGCKVNLLPHQKYSMLWLKWREQSYPHGSILADDMGLGKTLTILAYLKMIKDEREEHASSKKEKQEREQEEEEVDELANDSFNSKSYLKRIKKKKDKRESSAKRLKTLIILPASLLHQWQGEIKSKFERDSFKIHVYHEANRKKHCYNMEDNDMVFTTYEIVSREVELIDKVGNDIKGDSPLAKIKWKRIILDEAHRIKNHTTKASKVICNLRAKYRIAITGTPIHNSLNDLYSLVKFLHFEPLDNFSLWKYVFASESFTTKAGSVPTANAIERTKRLDSWTTFLADYLMLRRTKQDRFKGSNKKIVELPDKTVEIIKFGLANKEKHIYDMIFDESKDKVKDFLKNQRNRLLGKKTQKDAGSYSEIFVYLLRLRQACCHMSLLAECLDRDELQNQKLENGGLDGLMDNLTIADENGKKIKGEPTETDVSDKIKSVDLIKDDTDLTECLEKNSKSSKLSMLLTMLEKSLDESPEDKLIVVSQWTGVLSIVGKALEDRHIEYCEIKGSIKLFERNEIVERFNEKANTRLRVMLLSLTAGGVGLNLVGANKMFLLDIHWNPALEQQCGDRIYRVGQTKPVTIYKFLCENTIEERIQTIQDGKNSLANKVYGQSGTGPTSTKLTAQDFKLLFTDFES